MAKAKRKTITKPTKKPAPALEADHALITHCVQLVALLAANRAAYRADPEDSYARKVDAINTPKQNKLIEFITVTPATSWRGLFAKARTMQAMSEDAVCDYDGAAETHKACISLAQDCAALAMSAMEEKAVQS